jgi:hypothetical protein
MPPTHGIVVFIQALVKEPSRIPRQNSSSKPDCVAFAYPRADKEASNSPAHVSAMLRYFAIPCEHHDFSFFVCPSKKQSRQSHVRKALIRDLNKILWRDRMDVPSKCTIVRTGRDSVRLRALGMIGWQE